ncbi:MAG: ATP-binding protein [Enhygromyxa sp.]
MAELARDHRERDAGRDRLGREGVPQGVDTDAALEPRRLTDPRLLATLAKTDVLILDDWGPAAVGPPERRDLNEIMDDRYGSRSTIITSQFPMETCHDQLGDPTTADAICFVGRPRPSGCG